MNARQKGKRGEAEAARFLTERGFPATRFGYAQAAGDAEPDLKCPSIPIHWEIKRQETMRLYEWMDQSTKTAKPGNIPVVMHRRSRSDWLVTLSADDFLKLLAGCNFSQDGV